MEMRENRTLVLAAVLCLSGCATAPGMTRSELSATLTGHQQTPGPGDLDATGTARVRLDPAGGQLCWELNARGIGGATGAAIHRGAAGTNGPLVTALTTPDSAGRSQGCAAVAPDVARQMSLQAHQYYVTVADEAHPQGAIRGQLSGGFIRPERRPQQPRR